MVMMRIHKQTTKWRFRTGNVLILLVLFSFLCACIPLSKKPEPSIQPFSFSVMGDVPRGAAEIVILDSQIVNLNTQSTSKFSFHLGDFKRGSEPCDEAVYERVSSQLQKINQPVFMLMGDNEWNDCENPETAWDYWFKHFSIFENRWDHHLQVDHQIEQIDNFAFNYGGVLFLGLNVVGSRIHDQVIWDTIESNDIIWMRRNIENSHADALVIVAQANPALNHPNLLTTFQELAAEFKKPILFLHGDGHYWTFDSGWKTPNMTKIQIDKGSIADPLEVSYQPENTTPFSFDRDPFN
jgi:hypothetical protein